MRSHFKTETFPTLEELVSVFKVSKYNKEYCQFLNMYYNTLQNISKVYGFSLVRLEFEELMCIMQRTQFSIVIELRIN